ncbi:hypothetical protein [Dactylosporangium sp. NPDC051541]|uniref:hypothetical protein n=1 Tax=Dactylosporangium sp. NPDC051541 TaxID=3363977 RepID=UPI0037AA00BA
MTSPPPHHTTPERPDREKRNAALTDGIETGFWDDHGRPAPWPDDIDQWQPDTSEPHTHPAGTQPF